MQKVTERHGNPFAGRHRAPCFPKFVQEAAELYCGLRKASGVSTMFCGRRASLAVTHFLRYATSQNGPIRSFG